MKKYSSYKSIKPSSTSTSTNPLSTTPSPLTRPYPSSPTPHHSSSYRKLTPIDICEQSTNLSLYIAVESDICLGPLSAKYSSYIHYGSVANGNRKKILFSSSKGLLNNVNFNVNGDVNVNVGRN